MKNLKTLAALVGVLFLAFAPTNVSAQIGPEGGDFEITTRIIADSAGVPYLSQPITYHQVDDMVINSKGLAIWDEDVGMYINVVTLTVTGKPALIDGSLYIPTANEAGLAELLKYNKDSGMESLMYFDGIIRGVEDIEGGRATIYGSLFSVIIDGIETPIDHVVVLKLDDNSILEINLPVQPHHLGGIEEIEYIGDRLAYVFMTPDGAAVPFQALFELSWFNGWNEMTMTPTGPYFFSGPTSEKEFRVHPDGSKTVTGKLAAGTEYPCSIAYCPSGEDVWVLSNIHTAKSMTAAAVWNGTVYIGFSDNIDWVNGEVLTETWGPVMAIPLESFGNPTAGISAYIDIFNTEIPDNPRVEKIFIKDASLVMIGNDLFGDGFNASSIGVWGAVEAPTTTNEIVTTENTISIYPNPASDWVMVDLENIETIEVFNYFYQLVAVIKNKNTFSVGNLPAGNYIVKVATPSGIVTGKLVIIH